MTVSSRHNLLDWRLLMRAARNVLLILFPAALSLTLYSVAIEPYWLEVVYTDITIQGLPRGLADLTLIQISDLHLGIEPGSKLLDRIIEQVAIEDPDLVMITGDFLDARICQQSAEHREQLAQLTRLHGRYGVYAVLGNHDIVCGADDLVQRLNDTGVVVLRDELTRLEIGGEQMWLVGIEDVGVEMCPGWASFQELHRFKQEAVERLLIGVPTSAPRILLVHNPDFAEMLSDNLVDLVLAGHTHGGYLRLPFLGAPSSPSCFGNRYIAGLNEGSHTRVYTNRGIGGLSIRLNSRPEITVLRLTTGN